MAKEKKDVFLIARVPKSLKASITKLAKERGRSISKIVREILSNYIND